jgi:hypothetical protein
MDTILPEHHRTGARWVAGTGAFLIVTAAAIFIGVRWHELPDVAKFAIVAALTASCLVSGRVLRRTVPATADALFHLGALLLPVDLAGLNPRLHLGWRGLLLAEGVLVTVVLGAMALATGSVVLRRVAAIGGIALAGGVAAMTMLPAPLVLALFAIGALASGQLEAATVWATTAGLAPVIGAALAATTIGDGVLLELGRTGPGRLTSVASGLISAVVVGHVGMRRSDSRFAVVAIAAVAIGSADGWFAGRPGADADGTGITGVFLLVQLVALAFRRDAFWRRPLHWLATGAEWLAAPIAIGAAVGLAFAPVLQSLDFSGSVDPTVAVAGGLLAGGWIVAAIRRDRGRTISILNAFVIAAATVELATLHPLATAIAMAAAAGALLIVADRRVVGSPTAVSFVAAGLGVWSTATANSNGATCVVLGVIVAVGLAVVGARSNQIGLSIAATMALTGGLVAGELLAPSTALALIIGGTWVLALIGDLLESPRAGETSRWTMLAAVAGVQFLHPTQMVAPLVVGTIAFAIDAVRHDDERFAFVSVFVAQLAVLTIALAAGLRDGGPGLALVISAVVWSGLSVLAEGTCWERPLYAGTAVAAVLGLLVASLDPHSLATAAMIDGGLLVGLAVVLPSEGLGHIGGLLFSAGVIGHLQLAGIHAAELYVAPVAAQTLAAGWFARRRGASSWTAFTIPIVLLGGVAFAERIAGEPGWHAVVAGAIGLIAVMAGGWHRLAGPLVTGTALLVAITGYESLGVAATVPTWAWLAAGGVVLLITGVLLERNDQSPVEVGRRLVDVVAENFD